MCAGGWAEGNISRPNLVEELGKKNFVFNKGLVRQWGGRGCIRFTNENSSNHDPRGGPPHHPLSSWERTSPRFAPTSFNHLLHLFWLNPLPEMTLRYSLKRF